MYIDFPCQTHALKRLGMDNGCSGKRMLSDMDVIMVWGMDALLNV